VQHAGHLTSWTYVAWPVTLSWMSVRGIDLPTVVYPAGSFGVAVR